MIEQSKSEWESEHEVPSSPDNTKSNFCELNGCHVSNLESIGDKIHAQNVRAGWWSSLDGMPKQRNVGEMLMLCVSELSEAMEGHRKNLSDDKLPHRSMLEVELADAVIRILDMGAGLGLDVAGAIVEKMHYNAHREDHTIAHRATQNGKKY